MGDISTNKVFREVIMGDFPFFKENKTSSQYEIDRTLLRTYTDFDEKKDSSINWIVNISIKQSNGKPYLSVTRCSRQKAGSKIPHFKKNPHEWVTSVWNAYPEFLTESTRDYLKTEVFHIPLDRVVLNSNKETFFCINFSNSAEMTRCSSEAFPLSEIGLVNPENSNQLIIPSTIVNQLEKNKPIRCLYQTEDKSKTGNDSQPVLSATPPPQSTCMKDFMLLYRTLGAMSTVFAGDPNRAKDLSKKLIETYGKRNFHYGVSVLKHLEDENKNDGYTEQGFDVLDSSFKEERDEEKRQTLFVKQLRDSLSSNGSSVVQLGVRTEKLVNDSNFTYPFDKFAEKMGSTPNNHSLEKIKDDSEVLVRVAPLVIIAKQELRGLSRAEAFTGMTHSDSLISASAVGYSSLLYHLFKLPIENKNPDKDLSQSIEEVIAQAVRRFFSYYRPDANKKEEMKKWIQDKIHSMDPEKLTLEAFSSDPQSETVSFDAFCFGILALRHAVKSFQTGKEPSHIFMDSLLSVFQKGGHAETNASVVGMLLYALMGKEALIDLNLRDDLGHILTYEERVQSQNILRKTFVEKEDYKEAVEAKKMKKSDSHVAEKNPETLTDTQENTELFDSYEERVQSQNILRKTFVEKEDYKEYDSSRVVGKNPPPYMHSNVADQSGFSYESTQQPLYDSSNAVHNPYMSVVKPTLTAEGSSPLIFEVEGKVPADWKDADHNKRVLVISIPKEAIQHNSRLLQSCRHIAGSSRNKWFEMREDSEMYRFKIQAYRTTGSGDNVSLFALNFPGNKQEFKHDFIKGLGLNELGGTYSYPDDYSDKAKSGTEKEAFYLKPTYNQFIDKKSTGSPSGSIHMGEVRVILPKITAVLHTPLAVGNNDGSGTPKSVPSMNSPLSPSTPSGVTPLKMQRDDLFLSISGKGDWISDAKNSFKNERMLEIRVPKSILQSERVFLDECQKISDGCQRKAHSDGKVYTLSHPVPWFRFNDQDPDVYIFHIQSYRAKGPDENSLFALNFDQSSQNSFKNEFLKKVGLDRYGSSLNRNAFYLLPRFNKWAKMQSLDKMSPVDKQIGSLSRRDVSFDSAIKKIQSTKEAKESYVFLERTPEKDALHILIKDDKQGKEIIKKLQESNLGSLVRGTSSDLLNKGGRFGGKQKYWDISLKVDRIIDRAIFYERPDGGILKDRARSALKDLYEMTFLHDKTILDKGEIRTEILQKEYIGVEKDQIIFSDDFLNRHCNASFAVKINKNLVIKTPLQDLTIRQWRKVLGHHPIQILFSGDTYSLPKESFDHYLANMDDDLTRIVSVTLLDSGTDHGYFLSQSA